MKGSLKNTFGQAAITGEQALTIAPEAKSQMIIDCLQVLEDSANWEDHKEGSTMMHRVLQPYFALSGYKLGAEPEVAQKHRFDLVAENLIGGDDRILVDYKYNRDGKPRSLIPGAIINMVSEITPEDTTRILMISPNGFDVNIPGLSKRSAGPRLELWSFDDISNRLKQLRDHEPEPDQYTKVILDMIDNLALAIARADIELQRLEWREIERLIAHVLAELGYAVHLTNSSNDGGRDVIVVDVHQSGVPVFNIEVKHWTTAKVGNRETKRVLEVALRERRDGAVLWATGGIGPAAIEARSESYVDFLHFADGDKLAMTCRSYARKRGGLWCGVRPFQSFILN